MTTRAEMIQLKYLTARRHPTEPLTIYNYTSKTQIEHAWNEHTKECRGLIVHDDGRVMARPYRKFFNIGEPGAEMPASFVVYDKLDGSLGISYRRPSDGKICIASRGSFDSDQARHASALWDFRYAHVEIPEGQTWLFEIIYPENRIVLGYNGLDDLVLHGVVDIATGVDLPLPSSGEWPGPFVTSFPAAPIEEITSLRTGALIEGYVLREDPLPVDRPARRVKVKIDEYVRIHKLIDGITPRRIHEILKNGDDLVAHLDGMPDEFHREAMVTAELLRTRHAALVSAASAAWDSVLEEVGIAANRKEKALAVQARDQALQPLLFAFLSGKSPESIAWKHVEPPPMGTGGEA